MEILIKEERLFTIHKTISALLEKAEIPKNFIDQILDQQGVAEFERVLRHKSYDEVNNYEIDEFIGDNIVNLSVAKYVLKKFNVKKAGEATIIKHNIQSNKMLGELAVKYNILSMVLIKEDINAKIKGDIFEAFIGCLSRVIEGKRMESTAYLICDRVINVLLDELKLQTIGKDPITDFKETFVDYYRWGKMPEIIQTKRFDSNNVEVNVYGWVDDEQTGAKRKILLVNRKGKFEDLGNIKAEATKTAKQVLITRYGVSGKPSN